MPKKVGRPKSDIETEVIAVRIPVELGERLDRYLDRLEMQTGIKSNRNSIVRHALRLFLDAQERGEDSTLQKS
jgi:metal-responsive CopG/Arc/MetJ family transcriptional regulator